MKTCTKCGVEKPKTGFSKDNSRKDRLQLWCKVCRTAGAAAHYNTNRWKVATRGATYYAGNRETILARNAAYCAAHRETILARNAASYAANREERLASAQAWGIANPGKRSATRAQRRANQLQATPAWANKQKIEEFYYTADMLGMHTGDPYHVDHVVPLKNPLVCGLHCEFNLQVLTATDNLHKSNKFEVSP